MTFRLRYAVIVDREANRAEPEDERRRYVGSGPVFCTFGRFWDRFATCKSVRNPDEPVTYMSTNLKV